jgi:hypothetical protein
MIEVEAVSNPLVDAINQYGFPIIAAFFMGYFIFFVWKWVTEEIDPVIGASMGTLIKLVDRVRMLDNDLIRLNTKLAMVLEYKEEISEKANKEELDELTEILHKYKSFSAGAEPKK